MEIGSWFVEQEEGILALVVPEGAEVRKHHEAEEPPESEATLTYVERVTAFFDL
jgi:hypothetical protein